MKHLHIKIFGHVQGVCFRQSAQEVAQKLQLTGWVKNCQDGTVLIEAEGEERQLDTLLEWCQHGPLHASVEKVEYLFSMNLDNFLTFSIHTMDQ